MCVYKYMFKIKYWFLNKLDTVIDPQGRLKVNSYFFWKKVYFQIVSLVQI